MVAKACRACRRDVRARARPGIDGRHAPRTRPRGRPREWAALHHRRRPGVHPPRAPAGASGYRDAEGETIRDHAALARIRALAIPPAWTDVWICPGRTATCRPPDAMRAVASSTATTPRWRARREADKFDADARLRRRRCPRIRRRVRARPRDARVCRARRCWHGRPAARADADPGRQRRVRPAEQIVRADDPARPPCPRSSGSAVRFRFRGKSGDRTRSAFATGVSPRSSGAARSCPGRSCSSTSTTDGDVRDVASEDVNAYLREISGGDFTAKDFRTWAGTVLAYRALRALQPQDRARRRSGTSSRR